MTVGEILLLVSVAVAFFAVLTYLVVRKCLHKGGGCDGCDGNCAHCMRSRAHAQDKKHK